MTTLDNFSKHIKFTSLLLGSFMLYGCSTSGVTDPEDPYETFNRHSYAMNKKIDDVVIKPITKGYVAITPEPVQHSVHNFFNNTDEIFITVNSLLQADFAGAGKASGRFVINTTLGILGLFDVATKMGIEPHYTDFGLTLAKYGVEDSSYLMLPFFGPSTVRDAFGIPVDQVLLSPFTYIPAQYDYISYTLFALHAIDTRAQFLDQDQLINQSFDPYVFIRNAYMQNRNHMIKEMQAGKSVKRDSGAQQGIAASPPTDNNANTNSTNSDDIYIGDN